MHPHSDPAVRPAPAPRPGFAHEYAPVAEWRRPRAPRGHRMVGGAVLALLLATGAGLWAVSRRPLPPEPAGPPPTWRLDVRADGGRAPWILVFGREAGLHLVRASEIGRVATLPGRLPGRRISMMSLGKAPLAVRGDAGGAGGMRSFRAQGRVITVFHDGSGTGVRTGF
ncbi:hypothetical protein [Roseisolibacter agri]|uniref:Uncharacterized protein n=1 Tax=Roseisolibacter agri TaxID=2014610 RepID=A0AA37Q8Z9_9BACT|nr:hypothetical protein [Roseisolibacter agri]GLC25922.1 hypothetical protein rosag_24350 [Roseisolibacter agri]